MAHFCKGQEDIAANLSTGRTRCCAPDRRTWEDSQELWHRPFSLASVSSREAVVRQFLITTWVLMTYEAFCLALSLE